MRTPPLLMAATMDGQRMQARVTGSQRHSPGVQAALKLEEASHIIGGVDNLQTAHCKHEISHAQKANRVHMMKHGGMKAMKAQQAVGHIHGEGTRHRSLTCSLLGYRLLLLSEFTVTSTFSTASRLMARPVKASTWLLVLGCSMTYMKQEKNRPCRIHSGAGRMKALALAGTACMH